MGGGGSSKKFFIDIGANDPIIGSNSYIFEKLGWKGICIEPQPELFAKLKKIRNCDCYNVALSSQSGASVEFMKVGGGGHGLSGLSRTITKEQKNHAMEYGSIEYITVKTRTFEDIMQNYPDITHIDFMSIDVEGHEIEILKTIDFTKYTFGFITIERSHELSVKNIMEQKGYRFFMALGEDLTFVR